MRPRGHSIEVGGRHGATLGCLADIVRKRKLKMQGNSQVDGFKVTDVVDLSGTEIRYEHFTSRVLTNR